MHSTKVKEETKEMGFVLDCTKCESSFEITVTDHLLENGEPEIRYCPSCGTETVIDE